MTDKELARRGSNTPRRLTKLNVNLFPSAARALEALCEATGRNKTDTVNAALESYARKHATISGSPPPRHSRRDRMVRG